MVYRKHTLIKFAALLLTAAAIAPATNAWVVREVALAQSFGENPDGFPIPSSLPDNATLKVDGSTSMRVTNQELESRFESQYPDVDVELDASRTDEAIAALLNGTVDLVAAGRPLTAEEKAQGLVEVPLEREKLAFIVGSDNAFEGNLTFEQFAQIYRGQITNWSEVGGPDLPIRVVDRPEYSDTRRALSTYEVFAGQPFETGSTADPASDDETQTVMESLGNDGIGYAVFSQVQGLDTVRILPMHQTLPDDPRYPYSQYRAFVYRENATPAALAFLGFATTNPGEEAIAPLDEDAAAVVPPVTEEPDAEADPATAEVEEETTALVPDAAETDVEGGFPWWLWLLGIPLLGGLLWWLLKGLGGRAPAAPPVTPAAPPPAAPPPAAIPAAAAAVPLAAAAAAPEPRLILTPRNCQDAYAYWEVPDSRSDELKRQGGETLMVRLYDVTGRAKEAALPDHTAEFECVGPESDLHLPIALDDRDYRAELGYLTHDQRWLPLCTSDPVHVPACPKPTVTPRPTEAKEVANGASFPGAAIAGAAAVGAAAVGAAAVGAGQYVKKPVVPDSRIVLTPRDHQQAYAYWEVPMAAQTEAKAQGGESYQLRLYDATDINLDHQPPHSTLTYDVAETDSDRFVPLPAVDRDYIAEIGYRTGDGTWIDLARSEPVRATTVLDSVKPPAVGDIAPALGALGGLGAAAATAAAVKPSPTQPPVAAPTKGHCAIQTVNVHSRHNAVLLDAGQMSHLQDNIAATAPLDRGLYVLKIRDGVFNYDGDEQHPGEPFVLLWIYGGKVVNQKTGVPVNATWSTLNGYADTLTLDVHEPAHVCALFMDTFPEDNVGEVTLSVIKL